MREEIMRSLVLVLLSVFVHALRLDSAELTVNGKFQPAVNSKYSIPQLWHSQHTEEQEQERGKVCFVLSEPDREGFRTLLVKTAADHKKDPKFTWKQYCMFGTNPLETIEGDTFTLSFESAGTGKLRCGMLGYGTGGSTRNVPLSSDFRKFTFTFKTGMIKGDKDGKAFYRPFFEFFSGTEIRIRKVKLEKQNAPDDLARRAGFRRYPVFAMDRAPAGNPLTDEAIWQNIPEGKGFLINRLDRFQQISRQTSFKMAHFGGKLYVRIHCDEPFMDQVKADPAQWRDGVRSQDDMVEFCISSRRGKNLKHSYNLANSGGASSREDGLKTIPLSTFKGKSFWEVCLIFELDHLLINEEKITYGKEYYFNIGRTNYTGGNRYIHSSISKEFGHPSVFQIMELVKTPSNPELKQQAEDFFNGRYRAYLNDECRRIGRLRENDWKKLYGKYGRLDSEALKQANRLVRRARTAGTISERQKVVTDFQSFDENLKTAVKNVVMKVVNADSVKHFLLNGKPIPASSEMKLQLRQGVNVLCAETLSNAKVGFTLKGHPETAGAWRVADKAPADWHKPEFDDRKWNLASAASDGQFISPGRARQILFWTHDHTGKWPLFYNTAKWNFVNGSVNTLIAALDSPLPFGLDRMTLTIELPASYKMCVYRPPRIYPKTGRMIPSEYSNVPSSNKGYTRHQCTYKGDLPPVGKKPADRTGTYLVFLADHSQKAGTDFIFRYSRSCGNLVELMQTMPCRVLPPIRGSLLKNILIETWGSGYDNHLPADSFQGLDIREKYLQDRLAAGINLLANQQYFDKYNQPGVRQVILTCWPIWGSGWGKKGKLYEYAKNHPEAQARFFDDCVKWGGKAPSYSPRYMDHRETTMLCPSWITGAGSEIYLELATRDMAAMKAKQTSASLFFNNWEGSPKFKFPDNYCFCRRCVDEFRKFAAIPNHIDLTDAVIRDQYSARWHDFRTILDGKIAGLVKKAANRLGMKYFLYHGYAARDFWKAAAGNIDIPYQGCPGSSPADSKMQEVMDHVMKYMSDYGYANYVGQIFNPGWAGKYRIDSFNSYTGLFEPETTKMQIVRAVASNHGGISIWGQNLSGSYYYIGEATRLIAAFEDWFVHGKREDSLVESPEIAYPNALVLSLRDRNNKHSRLVLLFNESKTVKTATIKNLNLPPHTEVQIYESPRKIANPEKFTVTIPPADVSAVLLREK